MIDANYVDLAFPLTGKLLPLDNGYIPHFSQISRSQSLKALFHLGLTPIRMKQKKQHTVESLILSGFQQSRVTAPKTFFVRNAGQETIPAKLTARWKHLILQKLIPIYTHWCNSSGYRQTFLLRRQWAIETRKNRQQLQQIRNNLGLRTRMRLFLSGK